MRVAAIYDIHANMPALEAVLEQIAAASIDRIVVGGDVLPGPMPGETLTLLQNLRVPTDFILGNGETAVLQQLTGHPPVAVAPSFLPIIQWTAQQLGTEDDSLLRSWPKTIQFEIPPLGEVLFCHGTPRDENEIFSRVTPEPRLQSIFDNVAAAVVVCGHTHMQFEITVGALRICNAGSVGMPFGKPGAHWLLIGPDLQFQHTPYNLEAAAARIRATTYPQAEQFAANNILHPPSAEQMLQGFGLSEPK